MTTPPVAIFDESAKSLELSRSLNGFHLEPRCRVCRNDNVRELVNGMLARGASYGMIARAVQCDNATLEGNRPVTVDSIRNHTIRHFPVQNTALATYREILERRAKENGLDFINGVATAITPMAFLESVMVKGYETLVDSDTKVDINTVMNAATRLQTLLDARAGQPNVSLIKFKSAGSSRRSGGVFRTPCGPTLSTRWTSWMSPEGRAACNSKPPTRTTKTSIHMTTVIRRLLRKLTGLGSRRWSTTCSQPVAEKCCYPIEYKHAVLAASSLAKEALA